MFPLPESRHCRALVVREMSAEDGHLEHVGNGTFPVERDAADGYGIKADVLCYLEAVPAVQDGILVHIKRYTAASSSSKSSCGDPECRYLFD